MLKSEMAERIEELQEAIAQAIEELRSDDPDLGALEALLTDVLDQAEPQESVS